MFLPLHPEFRVLFGIFPLTLMRVVVIVLMMFSAAATVHARDVYVIGMFARGQALDPCVSLSWRSDVLFYNRTAVRQIVRLQDVSNGIIRPTTPRELEVPPGVVVSMSARYGLLWSPAGLNSPPPLWISRLDVPDGVTFEPNMELHEQWCTEHIIPGPVRGQLTLPAFDRLIPAGQQQIFLGTDVGLLDRRLNVAVFNAGTSEATADIDVHRSCDNATIASATVVLPANTVTQIGRVHSGVVDRPCEVQITRARGTYVVVRVDQPSLAFVSALINDETTKLTHNFVTGD